MSGIHTYGIVEEVAALRRAVKYLAWGLLLLANAVVLVVIFG